jgi:hypothetical protein
MNIVSNGRALTLIRHNFFGLLCLPEGGGEQSEIVAKVPLLQCEISVCNFSLDLFSSVYFLYRCVATNWLTKKSRYSSEGHLEVVPKSPFNRSPQFISVSSAMIETRVGANVTLDCAAAGSPLPDLIWTFLPRAPDGKPRPITNTSRNGINVVTLQHVTPGHTGTYTCTGSVPRDKPTTPITQVSIQFGGITCSAHNCPMSLALLAGAYVQCCIHELQVRTRKILQIIYIYIFNCNWVLARWQ